MNPIDIDGKSAKRKSTDSLYSEPYIRIIILSPNKKIDNNKTIETPARIFAVLQ
jgi:hypothetical protein